MCNILILSNAYSNTNNVYQLLLFLLCNCAALLYGVVARAGYFYNGVLCYITAIRCSDVCCSDGFVNFDVSGVKSESEKGV